MNTLVNDPVQDLVSEFPPASLAETTDSLAEILPASVNGTYEGIREKLTILYAYGLLGFGLLAPFVLAIWKLLATP